MKEDRATEHYPVSPWEAEAKRFMDQNNQKYAAAVAERREERERVEKELYHFIRKQG